MAAQRGDVLCHTVVRLGLASNRLLTGAHAALVRIQNVAFLAGRAAARVERPQRVGSSRASSAVIVRAVAIRVLLGAANTLAAAGWGTH